MSLPFIKISQRNGKINVTVKLQWKNIKKCVNIKCTRIRNNI